ncbi:MAG: antitoxin VapB [Mycobacterium sp.]|nr:antitoxin VapB [Mycobacterium sp.]MDT5192952.1 antitoxin VapB [Mycobacterium sp.]MDT5194853.1 antitoxin VapB [Mycobacterium sp.]MDT5292281.1 antitoxin VapB [Mycobacterium sp.]
MALNIKDPDAEALAAELARRLHTTKTGAVRHALRAQLAILESRSNDGLQNALHVLQTEVWPLTTPAKPITKGDREEILGYTEGGV